MLNLSSGSGDGCGGSSRAALPQLLLHLVVCVCVSSVRSCLSTQRPDCPMPSYCLTAVFPSTDSLVLLHRTFPLPHPARRIATLLEESDLTLTLCEHMEWHHEQWKLVWRLYGASADILNTAWYDVLDILIDLDYVDIDDLAPPTVTEVVEEAGEGQEDALAEETLVSFAGQTPVSFGGQTPVSVGGQSPGSLNSTLTCLDTACNPMDVQENWPISAVDDAAPTMTAMSIARLTGTREKFRVTAPTIYCKHYPDNSFYMALVFSEFEINHIRVVGVDGHISLAKCKKEYVESQRAEQRASLELARATKSSVAHFSGACQVNEDLGTESYAWADLLMSTNLHATCFRLLHAANPKWSRVNFHLSFRSSNAQQLEAAEARARFSDGG